MLPKTKEEVFSFPGSPAENYQDEEQLRKAVLISKVGDRDRLLKRQR